MRKNLTLILGLFLISFVMTLPARAEIQKFLGEDVEIMPLEYINPGMIGYGLSVFDESQKKEKFNVEIKTVILKGKNRHLIWAKIWGGPNNIIDRAGVIAGMSGSPIYLPDPKDGQYKLIGALAYGYSFQPPSEALTGITPIEEMLNLEELARAYYSKNQSSDRDKYLSDSKTTTIPLRIIGNTKSWEILKTEISKRLDSERIEIPESATNFRQIHSSLNTLEAGDAVAAVLSTGDLPLAAVGTVTLANSRGFLAFGHPFLWTGLSNIPVFKAEIGMVIPNLYASFKMQKNINEPQLGTIVVDSLEGIMGIWHSESTMLPLSIKFSKCFINNFKKEESWNVKIAQKNPLSDLVLIVSILNAVELGSPDLNNLNCNIKTDFSYLDNGIEQKLPISATFFSKTGGEIFENIFNLSDVYRMFAKAKKNLTGIETSITITQETAEIPTLYLESIEAGKFTVKPKEEISLGIMLTDKEKNYSKVIELQAPDFQGEIAIRVQNKDRYLQNLIQKALDDPARITQVFDFVKNSNNKEVLYLEIQYIRVITEREGKNNKGWKEASKKTEEIINKELKEVELPEIQGKFDVSASRECSIYVTSGKPKTEEETKKIESEKTFKFKPELFISSGIFLDLKGEMKLNLVGVDVGLLKYKRLEMLNFGIGISTTINEFGIYGKFAPVKINLWKNLFAEGSVAIDNKGKILFGLSLSLKIK